MSLGRSHALTATVAQLPVVQIHANSVPGVPGFTHTGQSAVGPPGVSTRPFGGIFWVERPVSVSEAHVVVNTAGSSGSLARIGLYRVNNPESSGSLTGDELVADFGTVNIASTGQKTATLGSAVVLRRGLHMTAVVSDSTSIYWFGASLGVVHGVAMHRATNVASNWRSFGINWGELADRSSWVSGGMPSSVTFASDSNIGGATAGGIMGQPVVFTWSFA